MIPSAHIEQHTPELGPEVALQNAAAAQGITLELDRLNQLTRVAKYTEVLKALYSDEARPESVFPATNSGVLASRTKFSERFGATAAKLDFTPTFRGEEDLVSGHTSAVHPNQAALTTLKLIHGVQDYVLLVEAGIVEKPAIVFAETNPQMAIVAGRAGMLSDIARQYPDNPEKARTLMREVPKMEIYGNYDEVSSYVFSERTQKLEHALAQRLAVGQLAGEVALSS